jgi:phosphoribosylanthranilate isomerase
VLIKICGITNPDDAFAAVDAGATALGFNFYPPSPRYIEPRAVRGIVDQLPPEVLTVGVFVNESSPAIVEQIAATAGVAALQLHGDESPEFCEQLKHQYVIKVLAVKSNFDPARATQYNVAAIMLDAFDRKLRGGTGQTIDWSLARRARDLVLRAFLAGGLSPENIAEAIAAVEPYAVDACSSLEKSPGRKDAGRMRAFVKAAQGAAR